MNQTVADIDAAIDQIRSDPHFISLMTHARGPQEDATLKLHNLRLRQLEMQRSELLKHHPNQEPKNVSTGRQTGLKAPNERKRTGMSKNPTSNQPEPTPERIPLFRPGNPHPSHIRSIAGTKKGSPAAGRRKTIAETELPPASKVHQRLAGQLTQLVQPAVGVSIKDARVKIAPPVIVESEVPAEVLKARPARGVGPQPVRSAHEVGVTPETPSTANGFHGKTQLSMDELLDAHEAAGGMPIDNIISVSALGGTTIPIELEVANYSNDDLIDDVNGIGELSMRWDEEPLPMPAEKSKPAAIAGGKKSLTPGTGKAKVSAALKPEEGDAAKPPRRKVVPKP